MSARDYQLERLFHNRSQAARNLADQARRIEHLVNSSVTAVVEEQPFALELEEDPMMGYEDITELLANTPQPGAGSGPSSPTFGGNEVREELGYGGDTAYYFDDPPPPPEYSGGALSEIFGTAIDDAIFVRASTENMLRMVCDPDGQFNKVGVLDADVHRVHYHARKLDAWVKQALQYSLRFYNDSKQVEAGTLQELQDTRNDSILLRQQLDEVERTNTSRAADVSALEAKLNQIEEETVQHVQLYVDHKAGMNEAQLSTLRHNLLNVRKMEHPAVTAEAKKAIDNVLVDVASAVMKRRKQKTQLKAEESELNSTLSGPSD